MERYRILPITECYGRMEHRLYPVVLFGPEDVVLVDCGYPGCSAVLEGALAEAGIRPEQLTRLLLTHQDDDHMGAAFELVRKYPQIQIAASRIERPYLTGEKKNLRLAQAEQLQEHLPEEQKAFGLQFCEQLRAVRPVKVDLEVEEGDWFPWAGGCRVLATPGHTPGHISLYLEEEQALITGDAAVAEGGRLELANPQFCLDLEQAERSLERLRGIPCARYICYHGGVLEKG